MGSQVPEIFSCLNIKALKEIAGEWAKEYKTIKHITLHPYPRSWRFDDELYLLVFEVEDPENRKKWGFPFIRDQACNRFHGQSFRSVYKEDMEGNAEGGLNRNPHIPWRFVDQWRIQILGLNEKRSEEISPDIIAQIYPRTPQEQKEDSEKEIKKLIENALVPVENLWKAILDKLHAADGLMKSVKEKELLKIAQAIFDENKPSPIKLEYLDRQLFTFSKSRKKWSKEKEDYEKRLMRKIVKDELNQSVAEHKIHQFIKAIRNETVTSE